MTTNTEAQGIANIITGLAQSVSEDKEMINSAFTDMTATIKSLQEKIEAMGKSTHNINIIKNIAGLTVELGITTTSTLPVTIKRLIIKMIQSLPRVKDVPTDIAMISDELGALR